jgi:hypothetical protein
MPFLYFTAVNTLHTMTVYLIVLGSNITYTGYCTKSCGWHSFAFFNAYQQNVMFRMPYGVVGDPSVK